MDPASPRRLRRGRDVLTEDGMVAVDIRRMSIAPDTDVFSGIHVMSDCILAVTPMMAAAPQAASEVAQMRPRCDCSAIDLDMTLTTDSHRTDATPDERYVIGRDVTTVPNSLASPAPARLETSGEEDSRCSVDQMSVSSACLNLDAFSSSSENDSQDSTERSGLSVTLFCDSDEAGTRVNSDQVSSDGDFPAESGTKDKRQVVRRCASLPGGQIIWTAQDDRQYKPPLPVVDLVTGKCKPGKVSYVGSDNCVYFRCGCAAAGGLFQC